MRNRVLAGAACLASALAVAGCGTTGATSTAISGSTATIFASLPLNGPDGATAHDVLDAEQLALKQAGGKAGRYTIDFVALNDATAAGWSPKLIAENARTVIQRDNAIAYIGEIDQGASAQSIPITNADNLLQVSPYDSALGLTRATPALPGSPGRYYESLSTNGHTFGRVVANDNYQAKAALQVMQGLGVKKLFIADDGSGYGDAIALAVQQYATSYGIKAQTPTQSTSGVAQSQADAFFYGGLESAAAAQAFNGAITASPQLKLFGPSALASDAFAASLSPAAQHATYLSEPGLTAADLPAAGQTFVSDFRAAYQHAPAVQAIYGYAAMKAVLRSIEAAGANANNRSQVVSAFLAQRNVSSALGTYSIDKQGDTSLAPYVFSRVKGGKLVTFKGLIVSP